MAWRAHGPEVRGLQRHVRPLPQGHNVVHGVGLASAVDAKRVDIKKRPSKPPPYCPVIEGVVWPGSPVFAISLLSVAAASTPRREGGAAGHSAGACWSSWHSFLIRPPESGHRWPASGQSCRRSLVPRWSCLTSRESATVVPLLVTPHPTTPISPPTSWSLHPRTRERWGTWWIPGSISACYASVKITMSVWSAVAAVCFWMMTSAFISAWSQFILYQPLPICTAALAAAAKAPPAVLVQVCREGPLFQQVEVLSR